MMAKTKKGTGGADTKSGRKKNEPETKDNTANAEDTEKAEALQQEETAEASLEDKLKEKEEKYLRLAAEFDNYRKRTIREKADLTRVAGEYILSDLLPVIDDFDRALESMDSASDMVAVKKGVQLIHGKFREFLKQKGVKEIQAMGAYFDTDMHEAVTKIPAPAKKEKGKVVDVIEKGYLLHDKVLRYARVVIGE